MSTDLAQSMRELAVEPIEILGEDAATMSLESLAGWQAMAEMAASCSVPCSCSCCVVCCCCCC